MQLYSTNDPNLRVNLREAVFRGLPEDKGLFMPLEIPELPQSFVHNLSSFSFQEIAYTVAQRLMQGALPESALRNIVEAAINFPAPVVHLDRHTHILELFHGPSLAFKDFGARFMAQLMSYYNQGEDKDLTILVATSGDTGGAVAAGFYQTPGIRVVILYPSGKVSPLQEKQLTTLGHNITALEVAGTFDDCQALVKQAFLDKDVTNRIRLSSANSINIARLIPQSFYYFEAYKQVADYRLPVVFSVPSGNFGNLTAGLLAKRMGLPVQQFIAATNINDVVPTYLSTGDYAPRNSARTLSNAMDVGNPSNFTRMLDLYGSTWNMMRAEIMGHSMSDEDTRSLMLGTVFRHRYIIDPHGAVALGGLQEYQKHHPDTAGVVLETAHPAKFLEDVEEILGQKIEVPERLAAIADSPKVAVSMGTLYAPFKDWLLSLD
jgi:threonine synthase